MAAGSTYTPISTYTMPSDASSVTIGSGGTIPNTYTDLVLVSSIQGSISGQGLAYQVNGDTGSNYSCTILRGYSAGAQSARISNNTEGLVSNVAEPPTAAFGAYICQFMNYSNATTYKTMLSRANNGAAGVDAIANLWRSTAAISSITVKITGGNMKAGSTFTLYGIAAA